jgi:DNA-binding MarR family transcriptional regulator
MDTSDLRRLQQQLKSLQRRQRAEFVTLPGLSRAAVRVLGVIARHADTSQPSQIGDALGMATSNVAAA